MRNTFLATLLELAAADPRLMLVVGDLGYSVVEPFAKRFPERFLNAGVAEQNMTGVAAGLAMAGLRPFTYSIANFPTLRCLEQIRNDIAYHRLGVVVVAVGGGLGYGALGYSHHAVQDLACLRTLPGMLLGTPGDPHETVAVTAHLARHEGPAYLRLGKGGEPAVHGAPLGALGLGPLLVRGGDERALLACGNILPVAAAAAAQSGATLYSCPLWDDSPETGAAIVRCVAAHRRVVVVEEHLAAGGFGSFVRERLEARPELQERVRCRALDAAVCGQVAKPEVLRQAGGLTCANLVEALGA